MPETVVIPASVTSYGEHSLQSIKNAKTLILLGTPTQMPTGFCCGSSFMNIVLTVDVEKNTTLDSDGNPPHDAFTALPSGSCIYVPTAVSISNLQKDAGTAIAVTNGGTFAANTTFTAGTLATPVKTGYTFAGWYATSDFSGDRVTTATAGTTYYAKWRELTITFADKIDENAFTYDGTAKSLTATLENTPNAAFTYTYALRTNTEGEGTFDAATSTAPANAGCYQVVATLSGTSRTATAYLEIKPADITATQKSVNVQQGDATLQQLDLTTLELTPNLSSIGAVTYTIQSTQDTNGIFDGAATIADGKLRFKLKEIVNAQHTASFAIKIVPASENFNPVIVTVMVQITKDTVAPTMTANPVSGIGTIIGLDDVITVTFSKKMVGTPAIAVSGGAGTAQAVLAQNGLSLTITPSDLVKGTAYTFTVNGLTDVAGNVLTSKDLICTTIQTAETSGTAMPTISGDTSIIDGNLDAIPANISLVYTAQAATADQNTLNATTNLPNGFSKTTVFFELELAVNGTIINNPILNRKITVTVPYAVASNTSYKIAHLKADGSVETLDATADYAKQTLTFNVISMSPFMVLSKYTAPDSSYDITITKEGNGTISPDGGGNNSVAVQERGDQTFTFTPDKGYVVSDVLVDGKSIGAKASYTFKDVTRAHTLKVIFKVSNNGHQNPQTSVAFEDVQERGGFVDSVCHAGNNGWFSGTSITTVSPYYFTIHGILATVLWRTEYEPSTAADAILEDVTSGMYYANGVNRVQANDIVGGYGKGKFGPEDHITREWLAGILTRFDERFFVK